MSPLFQMYYRVHASILNLIQSNDVIDYDLIEDHLDQADSSPFVAGVSKASEKVAHATKVGQSVAGKFSLSSQIC